MATRNNSLPLKIMFSVGLLFPVASAMSPLAAQAPAAPTAASQRGVVKTVSGNSITMATDQGQAYTVNVDTGARILQIPVGSTDLKSATTIQLTDIAPGDHILITGKAGDAPATFSAARVILMKSADIAQLQAKEQADWKARGVGGIVSSVDPASGDITITSGAKKIVINTSSKTDFRRFAGDSVKYQDAKSGTLAEIQPKDQLQARGAKSDDGSSVQAEEVVSGSFQDLSGSIASIDPAAGNITLKDLLTKKTVTVNIAAKADLRSMPAAMATRFAARSNGAAETAGRRAGGGGQDASGSAAADAGSARRSAGADLSQMIGQLPAISFADLHKGDAVMIVASQPSPGAGTMTAITVLTGVDPILTANPNGGLSLSMSLGAGGGE